MATSIVKWWRQLKKYKQFSGMSECTTDSEELIHHVQSSCMNSVKNIPCVNLYNEKQDHELNEKFNKRHSIAGIPRHHFEETNKLRTTNECEETIVEHPKPIQFSFTLYDLDGHGKITKDDIARIVSAIYDSLGEISVPHYGKKTINVKLTFCPENSKNQNLVIDCNEALIKRSVCQNEQTQLDNADTAAEQTTANQRSYLKEKNCVYESINNLKLKCQNKLPEMNNTHLKYPEINDKSKNEQQKCNVRKKIRKQRSRRQKRYRDGVEQPQTLDVPMRLRSYSAGNGNGNKWENDLNVKNDCKLNNNNNKNLRRNELIKIIRESMEKNRLCFQNNNHKIVDDLTSMRRRSNTISCAEHEVINKTSEIFKNIDHQQHLCSFDSFLHATVCSNINSVNISNECRTTQANNRHNIKPKNSFHFEQKCSKQSNHVETFHQKIEAHESMHDSKKLNGNEQKNIFCNQAMKNTSKEVNLNRLRQTLHAKYAKDVNNRKRLLDSSNNIAKLFENNEYEQLIDMADESDDSEPEEKPQQSAKPAAADSENLGASPSLKFVHIHHHYYHLNKNK